MRRAVLLWVGLLCLGGAQAVELRHLSGGVRVTFEDLRLPGDEWLGLVGLTRYLHVDGGRYLGLAAYGAVTGRRGGFFTGGFEAGWYGEMGRWRWGGGVFLGGGGGGAAPQGGGLMLRPQLELARRWGEGWLGAQLSEVRFPNGAIGSRQAALVLDRRWGFRFRPGWHSDGGLVPGRPHRHWFGVQSSHYFPPDGTPTTTGRAMVRADLIGVRWRPHLQGPWFLDLETAGAWGGRSDGFAQVLLGPSRWWALPGPFRAGLGVMVGAAGGGQVATGGGVVGRLWGGVNWLQGPWAWSLETGFTAARDGPFQAGTVTLGLLRRLQPLRLAERPHPVRWQRWRVRSAWQRYGTMGRADRKSPTAPRRPVDLVGVRLETVSARGRYLSGQAWGAFAGGAGGYAVGFLGLGWERPRGAWRPWAELNLGAAGGGGIAVGPGILAQPMLGLSRGLGRDGSLSLGFGRVAALAGPLSSWVGEVSLGYRFSTPATP